jgi:hypothetical protein
MQADDLALIIIQVRVYTDEGSEICHYSSSALRFFYYNFAFTFSCVNLNTTYVLVKLQDLSLLIQLVNLPDTVCHIPYGVQIHVLQKQLYDVKMNATFLMQAKSYF